jgi:hypothetical protein
MLQRIQKFHFIYIMPSSFLAFSMVDYILYIYMRVVNGVFLSKMVLMLLNMEQRFCNESSIRKLQNCLSTTGRNDEAPCS